MEIGMISSEELAKSFSTQNQSQTQTQNQNQLQTTQTQQFGIKSSEELAEEMANKAVNPDNTGKTAEQIAADAEAERIKAELEEQKGKAGRPKTKLDDSFKKGIDKLYQEKKLNLFSDGTDTGYIVPETWEDVLEVLDENKKIWEQSSKARDKEELLEEIIASKSPAWKFILENAETYKDPAELVPLLTAVQNIEYSASLDPEKETDQVKIIRATLSVQGLSSTDIESEIEFLKGSGKLGERATNLKPILDKYNQSQTEKILREKELEEQKKATFWNSYYQNLEENIFKAKDIDGVKLKNEHKQLIATTLIPDEKLGGLPIYTIIDNLIANGDFKTLSKIALLGTDAKLFDSYFLTKKADKAAEGIQKVLRQSGTSSTTTDFEEDDTNKQKPIRKRYGFFD